jgi:hypothetical protein
MAEKFFESEMKNQLVRITEERAHAGAEKRFLNTCGIVPGGSKKHQRMLEQGLKARESGIDGIDIRSLVRFVGPEAFRDGKIYVDDAVLDCNYFTRIPPEYVEGMYIYMMTVGECLFESEDKIMEFLFADIWGNSYVDSGIEALREDYVIPDMKKRFPGKNVFLSEEFGPGYYGMFVGRTMEFEKILDCASIGVKVKDSGMMIPQKSCAGLFFVLNHELEKEPACMRCMGNSKGCDFCEINMRRKQEGETISMRFMPMNIEYKGKALSSVLECASKVGVNIDGKIAHGNDASLQVGFTAQRSRYKELTSWSEDPTVPAIKNMPRTPNLYGYFTLTAAPVRHLDISLSGVYTGRMHVPHFAPTDEIPDGFPHSYIAKDEMVRTPHFFDFNTKVAYTFVLREHMKLQLNAGVQNIFNAFQNDLDKGTYRDSGYFYGPTQPRTFFMGIKIFN